MALLVTPLALLPGIVMIYIIKRSGKNTISDSEVLIFTKDLIRSYREGLLKAVETATARNYSFSKQIYYLISRYKLGSFASDSIHAPTRNQHLNELLGMILNALSSGINIKNSILQFESRLENEIKTGQRRTSRVGGMQYITYLGMAFFLPLFGGISSVILGTATGLLGNGNVSLQHGFIYSIAIYIIAVLAIDSFFNKQDSSALERLSSVISLFSVSAVVMMTSASYLNYVI